MKLFLSIAALLGFLSVAFGAFGAHALKEKIAPDMLEVFKTGVQYQMYHALALVGVAILLKFFPESNLLNYSGWFFIAGVILFSGSLYGLSLTGIRAFGPVTPFGGLCFLTGWLLLLIGALKI
jgi:uncharacterized membrane protein YgdD (TMEM256/DUF423 family)